MAESAPLTFLCITTYEKGQEFMRECKRQGCRVFLLTGETTYATPTGRVKAWTTSSTCPSTFPCQKS